MTSTTFVPNTGSIDADWLNDVNDVVYGRANVKLYGAVGDGVANDSAAFQLAVNSVTDGAPITIVIPAGIYDIVTFPTLGKRNVDWDFKDGASIATSTFQQAHATLVEGSGDSHAIHLNGDATEMGKVIDVRSRATSSASTSAYEKDGLFVVIQQDDDSSTAHASGQAAQRDAVGIGARGYIGAGVDGRIWALNAYAYVKDTASGEAICIECNLMNTQPPVSVIGDQNQCIGLKITTTSTAGFGASTAGTAAIHISNGTGDGWYKGVYAETADFVDTALSSFLELNGVFKVNRTGQLALGGEDIDGKCLIQGNEADLRLRTNAASASGAWVNYQENGVRNFSFGLDEATGRMRLTPVDGVTISHAAVGTAILEIDDNGSIGVNGWDRAGSVGAMFIANAGTIPASNPTGGGILYVEGGALKYRGSSGTITTLGAA